QNLLAPDVDRDSNIQQAIKHLAFDINMAAEGGPADRIPHDSKGRESLSETAFGLLSPERRIFRDRAKGGARKGGALFPLLGGLAAATGSDDGLGRRLREQMESFDTDWRERLVELFFPKASRDPGTAFASILLGGSAGAAKKADLSKVAKKRLSAFDRACCEFVDNLISPHADASRISAIRNLATGSYLITLIEMIAAVCALKSKKVPLVFVYGGMPPGESGDPIIRAACQSFQQWVTRSWQTTSEAIVDAMDATKTLPKSAPHEKR